MEVIEKKKKSATMDLVNGPVFRTLFLFSVPFVISTFLQTMYNTVDMMIVGNVVGRTGLSALSIGTQLMELITVFCTGFSSAGQVLISQYIGAGDRKGAKRVAGTLLVSLLVLVVTFTIITTVGCTTFLTWLNTPEESFAQARSYVTICGTGIIFTGLYNMVSAVFRGMGDSRHPLYFIMISTGINVCLDLLFVAGFGWGAAGAALATIIGQAVSVLCSFTLLYRHQEEYLFDFNRSLFHVDKGILKNLVKLGIPMALQMSAIQISFLFVNGSVNELGVVASAAFGASIKVRNLPGMLTQAVGMGATAMMGQNIGAQKMDRVKKIYLSSFAMCFCAMMCFAIPYALCPEAIFHLFTTDQDVLGYAGVAILWILIEMPCRMELSGGNGLVNASGFVKLSITLAIIDALVGRVVLSWFFGTYLGMGLEGYFIGYTMATFITAIPQFIYFLSGKWKYRRRLIA